MRVRVIVPLLTSDELQGQNVSSDHMVQAGGQLVSYSDAVLRSVYGHDYVGDERVTVIGFVSQEGATFTVCHADTTPAQLRRRQPAEFYTLDSGLQLVLTGCVTGCDDPDWCEHPRTVQLNEVAARIATDYTSRLLALMGPRRPD